MANTVIESDIVEVNATFDKVYAFADILGNFGKLLPEGVTGFTSKGDDCSYLVDGPVGPITFKMKLIERTPSTQVVYESYDGQYFDFKVFVNITDEGEEGKCDVQLVFEAELEPNIKMFVEPAMTEMYNFAAVRIQEEFA
jgi:carbon monoxide dehydrogenase subunit G